MNNTKNIDEILNGAEWHVMALRTRGKLTREEAKYCIFQDLMEMISDWCGCEDGYHYPGGRKEDPREKWPCTFCTDLRQSLHTYIYGGKDD